MLIAAFVGTLAYWTFAPPDKGTTSNFAPQNLEAVPLSLPTHPTRPVVTSTDPVRGNPAAPLAIVEFGDFLCAPCAETDSALQKFLADHPGKVKLVWKDFPNTRTHPLAQKAAEAARCAGAQNKFWEYHDLLFKNQDSLTETSLIQFARELNLNITDFQTCTESGQTTDLVNRSFKEGLLLRVDATPYFFIGERRFSGAVSEEELKNAISPTL